MSDPRKLAPGDPCPACSGELKPALVPTAAQFAKAMDRENPQALPPRADTASPETRAELGALYRCTSCGYQARFHEKGADGFMSREARDRATA